MSTHPQKMFTEAQIEWDSTGLPKAKLFNDVYFNSDGGIDESRYVFMTHNALSQRWNKMSGDSFTIGETGFGTGLNFLVAAKTWLEQSTQNNKTDTAIGTLHFVSVEKFPLSKTDLQRALRLWPELSELAEELIQLYPPPVAGIHRLHLANHRIILTLMYGEAQDMFSAIKSSDHPLFHRHNNPVIDAWFLDGFSPAKNPDMWSDALFQTMADLSQPHTTFSTFTAASSVRRGLEQVGFDVEKIQGFQNKREILCGKFTNITPQKTSEIDWTPAPFSSPYQSPWYLTPAIKKPETTIVIGGGIAGCATARALANRGIAVTLIERHKKVAQEGSGNPQGILYPKLSTSTSDLARFGTAALVNASRYYNNFLNDNKSGKQCGVLVLPHSIQDKELFEQITQLFPSEFVQLLTTEQLDQQVGLPLTNKFGLFFPKLGWIKPPTVCQLLTEHPLITLQTAEVTGIRSEPKSQKSSNQQTNCWQALDETGGVIATAPVIVIACGFDSSKFSQTNHLPLKKIRGQITAMPATNKSGALKTVLCGEGYIAPAVDGVHTLGATYNLGETITTVRSEDHQANMQQLATTDTALAEKFDELDIDHLPGRAAFRCTTPDYLPVAGPAPKLDDYLQDYQLMRKNARAHIPIEGSTWQGLYINIGHGSRGLSYAPLCAELVASQICGEVPPMELDLQQSLHPGRFIIRDIKRNKR
ncbi:MAG: bifunctional tRNA (5-methylaminomethyl-2-thiouridine)(34)-methyltransferase MnmD/FAD-dependent 5-carboxymethylaminomethyl-2-thiouridine(34) oxidoreductase MnmC [Porticoccus sp.]|nr:bifunctional tRNA (5-methylaminomethyl-2-thiouridine)(34)-methyltransferase MnmD/FAD-dependent 5-carboxymethylaminomethyl-2-thiouridine(34) oxidoreductase MnmC [Porticoccus sp.]